MGDDIRMDNERAKKVFPVFFPKDIIPKEAAHREEDVFRVCRFGKIEKDAFISTYEEVFIRKILEVKDLDKNDPGTYSTSVFKKRRDAKGIFNCIARHEPCAIVAFGKINPEHGPMQVTKERTGQKNSHIDWWLYDQADPSSEFEKVDINETK